MEKSKIITVASKALHGLSSELPLSLSPSLSLPLSPTPLFLSSSVLQLSWFPCHSYNVPTSFSPHLLTSGPLSFPPKAWLPSSLLLDSTLYLIHRSLLSAPYIGWGKSTLYSCEYSKHRVFFYYYLLIIVLLSKQL